MLDQPRGSFSDANWRNPDLVGCGWNSNNEVPFGMLLHILAQNLEGQDRQSPIASDFGSQAQIAALSANLTYRTVELRIANRTF